jgi:hypothetical protein
MSAKQGTVIEYREDQSYQEVTEQDHKEWGQ